VLVQVTNPAIDPLREGLVMSLESHLGARGNFLQVSLSNTKKRRATISYREQLRLLKGRVHRRES
jgi:hypothetical protein